MIKNMTFILPCMLFLLMAVSASADELKIGIVNAGVILEKSPQKSQALAKLEKEFLSRSKLLESRFKALREKQEALKKDAVILTTDELKSRERAILTEQRELKRLQDEYSEDFSIRRNEELRKLESEITQTIVDLAEKESYDLIMYQGVIFASDRTDITDKVLVLLKAKVAQ